jgi:hypothetical protein
MPADKKIDRDKLPEPEKQNKKQKTQDEYDDRSKMQREKLKAKRVNYVIKDLPIY